MQDLCNTWNIHQWCYIRSRPHSVHLMVRIYGHISGKEWRLKPLIASFCSIYFGFVPQLLHLVYLKLSCGWKSPITQNWREDGKLSLHNVGKINTTFMCPNFTSSCISLAMWTLHLRSVIAFDTQNFALLTTSTPAPRLSWDGVQPVMLDPRNTSPTHLTEPIYDTHTPSHWLTDRHNLSPSLESHLAD